MTIIMMMFLFLYIFLFHSLIQSCPLKTVNIHSGCYCGIEIDGTNYIQCHPYIIKKIPEFTRSYIYEKLNLSKNFIENLTNQSFLQLKVKRIYLENNPIKFIDKQTFSNNHNLLHYLEELYLDSISFHNIEFICHGQWKKLRILKLSGFNLNKYQYCFNKLNRLEKLIIENSQIDLISHHIYKLPFLYELSLINNQIKFLNFDEESLLYSSSIRILNLTSNQLKTIPYDLNFRLPHLITLDISYNLFENIPIINQMTLLNINLSFNLINYLKLNNFNLNYIDLSSNPICTIEKGIEYSTNIVLKNLTNLHCDCRLGTFIKTNLTDQLNIFDEQTICASPEKFQGLFLKDLIYEKLMNTCSNELPKNCKEITNFKNIQQDIIIENTTKTIETAEKLNDNLNSISLFRLTSFYTLYENNDLLIFWDFDTTSSSTNLLNIKFQIIIEQEISSKTETIRRTNYLSPYLKQYIIPHIPSNKNYYICLLVTRLSYGTDKYCREIRTSINQTFFQILFLNRSIIFGFLVGIILTTSFLVTFAFICHLHYKHKHSHHPLFNHQTQRQRYMYISRNDLDGTYTHSIVSSRSSKTPHRTYLTPIPPWYNRNSRQLSTNARSPCCFLQYHDRTSTSSTTTNQIRSLASDYSTGIDKEQMTSTSLMSNTSFDEPSQQQPNKTIQTTLTKHVYEELGDTNAFL